MKHGTETIRGVRVEVEVDTVGQFSATFDDQEYDAPTRKELLAKLEVAIKRAQRYKPIDVSVLNLVPKPTTRSWDSELYQEGPGVVQAKLRGYHQSQRVWLLTAVDGAHAGKKFQVGGYQREGIIARRLTLDETMRYTALCEALRVAETALKDFVGSVKIDPKQALEQQKEVTA